MVSIPLVLPSGLLVVFLLLLENIRSSRSIRLAELLKGELHPKLSYPFGWKVIGVRLCIRIASDIYIWYCKTALSLLPLLAWVLVIPSQF